MKAEVYSWRVSADLKTRLEREARRRKVSLSAVLNLAARDWLKKGEAEFGRNEEQLRLQRPQQAASGLSPAAMLIGPKRAPSFAEAL